MSQSCVAVLVFRSGQWTDEAARAALAPVLLPSVTDGHVTTALAGRWLWVDAAPLGFSAAVWRPSATSVRRDDQGLAVVDALLITALTQLAPAFQYFSIFEDHAEHSWLERVFTDLTTQRWDALLAPPYERVMLPPHLAHRYLDHPNWTVLADADAGVLVQTLGTP